MMKYKCVVVGVEGNSNGVSAAGKTSLVSRLKGESFTPRYQPTLGSNFESVSLTSSRRQATISTWDTAGQERFKSLVSLRDADIVLYCVNFSIDQPDIENIKQEIKKIKSGDGIVGCSPNATVILVATKCDLYPDDAQARVEQLASDVGVELCTITSAKTGLGFDEDKGQTLSNLILDNLPAKQEQAEAAPPIWPPLAHDGRAVLHAPIRPALTPDDSENVWLFRIREDITTRMLESLRNGDLTDKQRNAILAAIGELQISIADAQNTQTIEAAQAFAKKCHTILEGKHPYIMNAVYAFVGAVVVAGVIATAGILGLGLAAVVPVALTSSIWGGATGALISNSLFSRTVKQVREADLALTVFSNDVNVQLNPG